MSKCNGISPSLDELLFCFQNPTTSDTLELNQKFGFWEVSSGRLNLHSVFIMDF